MKGNGHPSTLLWGTWHPFNPHKSRRLAINMFVCILVCTANTYLYVPPRRYVFSGAEAYGRLIEDEDDDDDDDDDDGDSSLVSADNDNRLSDGECSDTGRPVADTDTNCHDTSACPPTPPEIAHLDSSNGSLDP